MANITVSTESSKMIIDEIGRKKIIEICNVSTSAITHWTNRGMPIAWAKYLRLRFPRLQCWKEIPEDIVK